MPEIRYLRNWVKRKPREWKQHILPLQDTTPSIRLLEIGVFEGKSACWWLDNLLTRAGDFYLGIDPWNYKIMQGDFCDPRAMSQVHRTAIESLKLYGDKVQLYRGTTVQAFRPAPELEQVLRPESFGVAYIDGDHETPGVMFDSVHVWPLVQTGGIILWDDWNSANNRRKYVWFRSSLSKFLALVKGKHEILWEGAQLGIRKLRS